MRIERAVTTENLPQSLSRYVRRTAVATSAFVSKQAPQVGVKRFLRRGFFVLKMSSPKSLSVMRSALKVSLCLTTIGSSAIGFG
jgi:hypothetical protein